MCKNTHLSIWIQIDPHCGTNLTCKKDVHRHTPVGNVILWILRSKKNHLHCTFFLKNFSTLCLCWSSSCFYCLLIWIHSVVVLAMRAMPPSQPFRCDGAAVCDAMATGELFSSENCVTPASQCAPALLCARRNSHYYWLSRHKRNYYFKFMSEFV